MEIVLLVESTSGVPSDGTIIINGTYLKVGSKIDLKLELLKGLHNEELLSQIPISFILEKSLVAAPDNSLKEAAHTHGWEIADWHSEMK